MRRIGRIMAPLRCRFRRKASVQSAPGIRRRAGCRWQVSRCATGFQSLIPDGTSPYPSALSAIRRSSRGRDPRRGERWRHPPRPDVWSEGMAAATPPQMGGAPGETHAAAPSAWPRQQGAAGGAPRRGSLSTRAERRSGREALGRCRSRRGRFIPRTVCLGRQHRPSHDQIPLEDRLLETFGDSASDLGSSAWHSRQGPVTADIHLIRFFPTGAPSFSARTRKQKQSAPWCSSEGPWKSHPSGTRVRDSAAARGHGNGDPVLTSPSWHR